MLKIEPINVFIIHFVSVPRFSNLSFISSTIMNIITDTSVCKKSWVILCLVWLFPNDPTGRHPWMIIHRLVSRALIITMPISIAVVIRVLPTDRKISYFQWCGICCQSLSMHVGQSGLSGFNHIALFQASIPLLIFQAIHLRRYGLAIDW